MRQVPRKPWLAALLTGLLASAACGTDESPNMLITRIGEPRSKEAALDCVATEPQPGAPAQLTLSHDAGLHVERTLVDGGVSVQVSSSREVLARRSYDAAFIAGQQADHFRVMVDNRSILLTFWAASNCAAPAPGEPPRGPDEQPPERVQ